MGVYGVMGPLIEKRAFVHTCYHTLVRTRGHISPDKIVRLHGLLQAMKITKSLLNVWSTIYPNYHCSHHIIYSY